MAASSAKYSCSRHVSIRDRSISDWSALLLAGFCLATAVLFHIKLGNRNELLHFEKDLAIAGGLLVLFAHGAGRWALDAQPWRSSQSDAAALRVHAPSLPGRSQR